MSTSDRIAIGGIVAQIIIGIITVAVTWYVGRRQIQIMLAQANPAVKVARTKILWDVYIVLVSSSLGLAVVLFTTTYFFIYIPFSPRVLMLLLLMNVLSAAYDYRILRLWWRKPRYITSEA
ncbi:MAG: hypothetical protein H0T60_03340 [Acidobacteria bacterium]|nr:hypothetical protein [Acidobacteriota bacterium]